jgi:hypothetical protein
LLSSHLGVVGEKTVSPYKLIRGSDKNIAAFEEQIANAMLDGYDLATDLVVQPRTGANGETEVLLFQAMICEEILDFDEGEEEDEELDEFEEEEEDEEVSR